MKILICIILNTPSFTVIRFDIIHQEDQIMMKSYILWLDAKIEVKKSSFSPSKKTWSIRPFYFSIFLLGRNHLNERTGCLKIPRNVQSIQSKDTNTESKCFPIYLGKRYASSVLQNIFQWAWILIARMRGGFSSFLLTCIPELNRIILCQLSGAGNVIFKT